MKCSRSGLNRKPTVFLAFLIALFALMAGMAAAAETAEWEETRLSGRFAGLASGVLKHAQLAELETGLLLRSGDIRISGEDLEAEIASYPPYLQENLRKDRFLALEEMARSKLLAAEARAALEQAGEMPEEEREGDMVRKYLAKMLEGVTVSEEEVEAFYQSNKARLGGATLDMVKPAIERMLLQEKKEQALTAHVESIGRRRRIEIQADWAEEQYESVKKNAINRVLRKGKPVLVAFGGEACCGPDMTQPLLEMIREEHGERLHVLYVETQEQWHLAVRCHVQSIPTFILYDTQGQEQARHVGEAWEQDMAAMLAKVGL